MNNVRMIYADWYGGAIWSSGSGTQLAYQYDHLSDMIIFRNAPKLENYYLIVSMKETEDGEVKTMEPIQLGGSFWLIPNVYTQIPQTISFQVCCRTESGDFEQHSAHFSGVILPSKNHDGETLDVDPTPMFDAYKEWVNKQAMAAGAIVVDPTLSVLGAAADAKATGDAVAGLNERLDQLSGGLTDEAKYALLSCFEGVAWAVADGQDRYDALELALFPPAELTSISAVYTQGGTVYDSDSLNDLKEDLVVTAHYSDSTTEEISNYTLSGTLAVGTSTVTVGYGGKTATFSVTVTAEPPIEITSESANVGFGALSLASGAPTYVTNTNKNRIHAIGGNLTGYPLEYGYKYTLSVTGQGYSTIQINVQQWNATAKQAVENRVNGSASDLIDGAWTDFNENSPIEVTPPAQINGSAPAFMWLNFRRNSSNANFSVVSEIGTITITKERVS